MIPIIIPNFNGQKHLEVCLSSIRNQSFKDYHIIVVDNGSTDHSVKFIYENYKEIEIIELDKNYGFAKAVNAGIKKALENKLITHIILLNNDIECDKNFLQEMIKGFISSEIGSVASKMLNYFDRTIIDNTGDFVNAKGFPIMRGWREKDNGQYDNAEEIFGACAGAAAYKPEIFEKVGYFDESFFAYFEDVDFNCRLQLQGFKCHYNPQAICYHKREGTFGSGSLLNRYLVEKNIDAYKIKNFPISILMKYGISYNYQKFKRFYFCLRDGSFAHFFAGLKGFLCSLFLLGKYIKKRHSIQKNIKVSKGYINSIFERDH